MDLVGGVDGDEDRADFGGGPEGDVPGRDIGGPDGDLRPGFDAQRHQGTGEVVHILPEFLIGAGVVEGGVLEGVLVGEFLHHPVEDLGEGQVDQLVLLPDVLAGAVVVEVEGLLLASGVVEAVHVVDEVGEDDLPVLEILHPLGLPLEGDEAVVVDGAEGPHHVGHGQGALADQVVGLGVVGVPQVDVADVGAQVLDCRVSALALVAVGVVDVPEGGELVAGEVIHQGAEPGRVGVDAAGLEEDGHVQPLGLGQEAPQILAHRVLVVGEGAGRHVGHLGVAGRLHQTAHCLRPAVGKIHGGVEAGNFQLLLPELADGCRRLVLVEGAAAVLKGRELLEVVDLDAAEFHVKGGVDPLLPGEIGPAAGGKGEVHASSSS